MKEKPIMDENITFTLELSKCDTEKDTIKALLQLLLVTGAILNSKKEPLLASAVIDISVKVAHQFLTEKEIGDVLDSAQKQVSNRTTSPIINKNSILN